MIQLIMALSLSACLSTPPKLDVSQVLPAPTDSFLQWLTPIVQLVGQVRSGEDPELHMTVRFDPNFSGVSLPYDLYAVRVEQDGQVLAEFDYTEGCTAPGIGFYSGQAVELPVVRLLSTENVRIKVWARR